MCMHNIICNLLCVYLDIKIPCMCMTSNYIQGAKGSCGFYIYPTWDVYNFNCVIWYLHALVNSFHKSKGVVDISASNACKWEIHFNRVTSHVNSVDRWRLIVLLTMLKDNLWITLPLLLPHVHLPYSYILHMCLLRLARKSSVCI